MVRTTFQDLLLIPFAALAVHTLQWSWFFSTKEFLHLPKRWGSCCVHEGKRRLSNIEFTHFLLSTLEHQTDKFSYTLLYCKTLKKNGSERASRSEAEWDRTELFFGVELFKARWTAGDGKFKIVQWLPAKGFSVNIHVVFRSILNTWKFLEAKATRLHRPSKNTNKEEKKSEVWWEFI